MAAQVKDAAWMQWVSTWLGGTPRQTYASTFPPDRFYCLLDELPFHLIPHAAPGILQEGPLGAMFLNPDCRVFPEGRLPDELASQQELVANFASQGTMAWVRDSGTGALLPFWLGPRLETAVKSLRSGQDARAFLSRKDRRILLAAGILRAGDSPRLSLESVGDLQRIYSVRGYAAFPKLIHPFHVAALRRYYRYLIRKGRIPLGDVQCPQRYVAYNEPVARFFHHELAKVVSSVAGEPVKPSYVYVASYLSGAELKKHTDREQCEFSVSFCLDFSPEPEGETPWPLRLDAPGGTVSIYQAVGDGLFYRGTRLPHYRDALGEGLTSTSIFFHYVSAGFTGSLA